MTFDEYFAKQPPVPVPVPAAVRQQLRNAQREALADCWNAAIDEITIKVMADGETAGLLKQIFESAKVPIRPPLK